MGNICSPSLSRDHNGADLSSQQRELLKESLKKAAVGRTDEAVQDGRDFYKFFFKANPRIRHHFVGAAEINAEDIQTCPRFAQQGQRFLLSIHMLAASIDNAEAFAAYTREVVNKHIDYEVNPSMWRTIFDIFADFLQTRGNMTDDEIEAWRALGEKFYHTAQCHLLELCLPTDPEWKNPLIYPGHK